MKKLLVITIIACVSSSAFAHRKDAFLGEFDELVAAAMTASNTVATTKTTLDADDLLYQQMAKEQYYNNELLKKKSIYDAATKTRTAQTTWDALAANEENGAKYKFNSTIEDKVAADPIIINNTLKKYETIAKSDNYYAARKAIRHNETDDYVDKQTELGLKDAARETECVKKIQGALEIYGMAALDAMGSSWERSCPAAANLIAYAQSKTLNAASDKSDYGTAADGWSAADYAK